MRPGEPEQFSGGRQHAPAASQSTQTPEQPALPELTTDTYGNAAVGYQAAVVSANEYLPSAWISWRRGATRWTPRWP